MNREYLERLLRELLAFRRRNANTVAPTTSTLGALGEAWLSAREKAGEIRDPKTDRGRWRVHVASARISSMPVAEIRRADVRDWLREVRTQVSRQTTLSALQLVRGVLATAVEDELIATNPAADQKLPKEARTHDVWTFATLEEQFGLILSAPVNDRALVGVAIGAGLRAGELVSLRTQDVFTEGDKPRIIVRYGTPPNIATKGKRIRTVPLFGVALEAMRIHLATRANDSEIVFPRVNGSFRDPDHVISPWATWKGMLSDAGITRRFRFHDMRHTCASSLISGMWGPAWRLEEVQALLGHSSRSTTERYAHLAGTALEKAGAMMRPANDARQEAA